MSAVGEVSPQLHYIRRDSSRGSCVTARRANSHLAHFSIPAAEAPQVSGSSLSSFSLLLTRSHAALNILQHLLRFCYFFPTEAPNDERRLLPGWTPAHHQRSQQLAGGGPRQQPHVRSTQPLLVLIMLYPVFISLTTLLFETNFPLTSLHEFDM